MQLLAMKGVASAIIGTGSKFMPLPFGPAQGTGGTGTLCLCAMVSVYTVRYS